MFIFIFMFIFISIFIFISTFIFICIFIYHACMYVCMSVCHYFPSSISCLFHFTSFTYLCHSISFHCKLTTHNKNLVAARLTCKISRGDSKRLVCKSICVHLFYLNLCDVDAVQMLCGCCKCLGGGVITGGSISSKATTFAPVFSSDPTLTESAAVFPPLPRVSLRARPPPFPDK